ncbi:uncharacterized protein JN550_005954 [Neoarthrinium moseri]|uniref:uncharacterized protein n=1 Tax=Neoarthrinium moseri TaxID=1658444 RepID=UPI001FDE0EBA|nr:uncharacterized protein JN550_005954 [Neoarthrinium moseri]KAI1869324.1 hypothetical protein JN550_005954 [Neoarthrinium moseri]
MAPRRVIADSDDEDDDELSPVKSVAGAISAAGDPRLDIEPLSPHHRPASPIVRESSLLTLNERSGSTNPSFFANVYEEQQGNALQQSHLIESIVRLSQRASASSGDISSPGKGKAKGKRSSTNASSATDLTSPVLLSKKPPRRSQLAQMSDATEFTTPRKSAPNDEWEFPDSGDELAAPGSKNTKARLSRISGKRRRGDPTTAPEAPIRGELEVVDLIDTSSEHDVSKRRKVSATAAADSAVQEAGTFYVAQSNLSTSQKQKYRRVQISDERASEAIPDSGAQHHSNQKSSCATTIAYSTPSRYASSGPRPPWELEQQEAREDDHEDGFAHAEPIDDELFEEPTSDLDPEYGESTESRKKAKTKRPATTPKSSVPSKEASQPKKRGRPKKQPVTEEVPPMEDPTANHSDALPPTAPVPNPGPESEPVAKPKKKRGRPRKSEIPINDDVGDQIPTFEEQSGTNETKLGVPPGRHLEDESTAIEDSGKEVEANAATKPTDHQSKPKQPPNPKECALPLKETDRNSMLRSQSTLSDSDKSTATTSLSKYTPSQAGKSVYRVGLSKRSRIAPLLKSLKK